MDIPLQLPRSLFHGLRAAPGHVEFVGLGQFPIGGATFGFHPLIS
jgi:hypothetical protein